MGKTSKPGVDWAEIEKRVKAGEPYRKIAADPNVEVSHVRISQRAREYGWHHERKVSKARKRINGKTGWKAELERSETVRMHRNPATQGERKIVTMGLRSPENAEAILESLEDGLSENVAAALVGISPTTLNTWRKEDPEFGELCRLARLRSMESREINIRKAGDRGDWKADLAILQSSKDTKESWGGETKQGPAFSININLRANDDTLNPPSIDVSPTETEQTE